MTMNNGESTDEFDAFVAEGNVEIGDSNLASQTDKDEKSKKAPEPEAEPADDDVTFDETDTGADDDGQDDAGEGEEDNDPKKKARESQIQRLKREKAELARQLRETERTATQQLLDRLENLEKSLQGGNANDNKPARTPAPDPTDADKYPLGHLDDRYIEDKLEWLAEEKAAKQADAVLQRQQENERNQALKKEQAVLLEKVDTLATRGSELFDDFQESVVEAGMRGDWDLSQTTFEAAHDADNGVQILYELANNPKEASRVAKLSPFQQLKYVQERDAEISKGKTPRRVPQAGDPPKNMPRGANSRVQINPATDNLDDFEKAWENDAKRGR